MNAVTVIAVGFLLAVLEHGTEPDGVGAESFDVIKSALDAFEIAALK